MYKLVIQTKKDAKGKFGRMLGDLVADGKNINQLMIAKHMAVRYIGQSKSDMESEHLLNRKVLIQEGLFTPVEMNDFIQIINEVGFPIATALGLGFFIWKLN